MGLLTSRNPWEETGRRVGCVPGEAGGLFQLLFPFQETGSVSLRSGCIEHIYTITPRPFLCPDSLLCPVPHPKELREVSRSYVPENACVSQPFSSVLTPEILFSCLSFK